MWCVFGLHPPDSLDGACLSSTGPFHGHATVPGRNERREPFLRSTALVGAGLGLFGCHLLTPQGEDALPDPGSGSVFFLGCPWWQSKRSRRT
jgi:hypothetical protein